MRAALDELGMKYSLNLKDARISGGMGQWRHGCIYFVDVDVEVAFFNRFGGLFYFHFFIGQVWWTFLFLFFHWPGSVDYRKTFSVGVFADVD